MTTKKQRLIVPKPGDVVNPDGDILAADGMLIHRGKFAIGYEQGLMALRYGWRLLGANSQILLIEKR